MLLALLFVIPLFGVFGISIVMSYQLLDINRIKKFSLITSIFNLLISLIIFITYVFIIIMFLLILPYLANPIIYSFLIIFLIILIFILPKKKRLNSDKLIFIFYLFGALKK
jgi:hypothetical protein